MGNSSKKDIIKEDIIREGNIIYPSGSRYKGFIKNNQRYGYGMYNRYDGTMYEGSWINDKRHGKGVFTNKNGDTYNVQFVDDIADIDGPMFSTSVEIVGPTNLPKEYVLSAVKHERSGDGGTLIIFF